MTVFCGVFADFAKVGPSPKIGVTFNPESKFVGLQTRPVLRLVRVIIRIADSGEADYNLWFFLGAWAREF